MDRMLDWLSAGGVLPLGACMGWSRPLIALNVTADLLIGASFLAIPFGMVWFFRRRPDLKGTSRRIAWLFGLFILAAGVSHMLAALAVWAPVYPLQGVTKAVTAIISFATIGFMWPLLPSLVRLPSAQQLRDANQRMRSEVAAHEATLRELDAARRELEQRVAARTRELTLVKARFETALHGAKIIVFSQDADLRYTWIYTPEGAEVAKATIGRTDDELLAEPDRTAVVSVKRRVLATGKPESTEVPNTRDGETAMFSLHVDPIFDPDGQVEGIMCAAVDVTRIRRLEQEQRRLAEELGTAVQRYETALRGSNVTIFTQDRELRYTSISNPLFGLPVDKIVGRTDEDVVPAESRAAVIALKQAALADGLTKDQELRIVQSGMSRWYDLHIEPLRDLSGALVGLSCAAVDVTDRKEGEAHLRLLMRELTHRSKNLLAVIQAMSRQTARHAGTIDAFLEQFSARLQALARSHDLLVQESWHGASLNELVRLQLGHYLDRGASQVTVDGTPLFLRPEAAQSLGLALHELATNAAKYGALSVPTGHVTIRWQPQPAREGIELTWSERGGPSVRPPDRRGFGSLVIEKNLSRSLNATVAMTFEPGGLCCRILIPVEHLYGVS